MAGTVAHARPSTSRLNQPLKTKELNVNRTLYSGLAAVILGAPFGVSLTAHAAPLGWARAKQANFLRAKGRMPPGAFAKSASQDPQATVGAKPMSVGQDAMAGAPQRQRPI